MRDGSDVDSLGRFARENGGLLLAMKIARAVPLRLRDALLSRRLRTSGLHLGRGPRLAGLAHMRIGRNLAAGDALWLDAITAFGGERFDPLLTIGDDCNLSDGVHIACTHRVTIGSGLLCGSHVLLSDHSHGRYRSGIAATEQSSPHLRPSLRPLSRDRSVAIGDNVWLGDGVVVLGGAVIGDGAVIGANAVVAGRIPAASIAVGAPARVIRQWNAELRQWTSLPANAE